MKQRQRSDTAAPLFAEEVGRSRDACLPSSGNVRRARAGQSPRGHEQFEAQAMAARIACQQVTGPALTAVRNSVNRSSSLRARPEWERKATAHAEIFHLLADAAGDYAVAGELRAMAGLVRDLMLTLGPTADTMVISSRQRLLAHLHAGDTDSAAMEMEDHLRVLRYMGRVARRSAAQEIKEHAARSGQASGRTARLTKASTTCREAS